MDPEVPLVVPEVNPAQVRNVRRGSSQPKLHDADDDGRLGALHSRWGLTDVGWRRTKAASGAGKPGADRLFDELEVVGG
jgi:aspartate-semialdehyde dehydrogenase